MTSTMKRDFAMPGARARSGSVHVVSADRRARRLARSVIRGLGYSVQSFASGSDFLSQGVALHPDCVLLDSGLPGNAAPGVQWVAQHAAVRIPVVLIGDARTSVAIAVQAMKSGAVDFLCAPMPTSDLEAAVASAIAVASVWRAEDMRRKRASVLADRLTPRERAVFALVLEGKLNKQIAAALDSQEATVKVHRSRLMRKLEVRSLAELLALGREFDRDMLHAELRHRVVPLEVGSGRVPILRGALRSPGRRDYRDDAGKAA